jgi:hypothetical protein
MKMEKKIESSLSLAKTVRLTREMLSIHQTVEFEVASQIEGVRGLLALPNAGSLHKMPSDRDVSVLPALTKSHARASRSNTMPINLLGPSPTDLQSHLYASFLAAKTADVTLHVRGSWEAVYQLHRVILIQAVSSPTASFVSDFISKGS